MLHTFNENRKRFYPYGFTCELWKKSKTSKPDRHNEIEINFLIGGTLSYLFHDKKIKLPQGKIILFWALNPHQIIDFSGDEPYYVCTIPFDIFLSWNFPSSFLNQLCNGNILIESNSLKLKNNLELFDKWRNDIESDSDDLKQIVQLEIYALLRRLIYQGYEAIGVNIDSKIEINKIEFVERMVTYIITNYTNDINVNDVANKVHFHPDYANKLFKKAFGVTIKEYITELRISHTKRLLITSKKKISTIAYESGFNSLSRFNATFLKVIGITPNRYRESQKV